MVDAAFTSFRRHTLAFDAYFRAHRLAIKPIVLLHLVSFVALARTVLLAYTVHALRLTSQPAYVSVLFGRLEISQACAYSAVGAVRV